jgi:hypothetical protein
MSIDAELDKFIDELPMHVRNNVLKHVKLPHTQEDVVLQDKVTTKREHHYIRNVISFTLWIFIGIGVVLILVLTVIIGVLHHLRSELESTK